MKLHWRYYSKLQPPGDRWGMTVDGVGVTIGSPYVPDWVWDIWDLVNYDSTVAAVEARRKLVDSL